MLTVRGERWTLSGEAAGLDSTGKLGAGLE